MTAQREAASATAGLEIAAAARELLAAMMLQPWGQVSPSVYETARLVALAPWLPGHAERLDYLLTTQQAGGGWGAPDGYALVPTLSAVDALLVTVLGGEGGGTAYPTRARLISAVERGLRALSGWLDADSAISIPDTPAVDLIVPALVDSLNRNLQRLDGTVRDGLERWRGAEPLPLPRGMTRGRLDGVTHLLASGRPVPQKLLHALEVLGVNARRQPGVAAVAGAIGASPAATAAWLGEPGAEPVDPAVLAYLDEAVRLADGPVPCCTPITVFERSWVLSNLARAGVPLPSAPKPVASLTDALGPAGTPTSPGLPADADTTSVTIYALAQLGQPVDPASLLAYDVGSHFCTWLGEDGYSVSTNAHVLDALGWHVRHNPPGDPRYASVPARIARWLCEQQDPDGHWSDRWHASPYYATSCAVLALNGYAPAGLAGEALDRAVDWVVATQRPDGSWGRWGGTIEETAYALHVLLGVGRPERPGVRAAAARGLYYLESPDSQDGEPPLWHDKDLYRPTLIVAAATLAARQLAQIRSDLLIPHRPGGSKLPTNIWRSGTLE